MQKLLIILLIAFIINPALFASENSDKVEVFNKAKESVVLVRVFEKPTIGFQSTYSQGSGYVVDDMGLVLTNKHVIEDAIGINVQIYKNDSLETYPAYTVWKDEGLDLAIIKIDKSDLKALEFAEDSEIYQGEEILVLGYPGASAKNQSIKVTWGLLSSGINDSTLQTTAPINPGNSGGPAIDFDGKVIGTVFSKYVSIFVESTGFLRNIKYAREAVNNAKDTLKDIDDYFGTKNYEAYKKLCLAVSYSWETLDNEDDEENLASMENAIELAEEALGLENDYTDARYYLAHFYSRAAFMQCEYYNNVEAGEFAAKYLNTMGYFDIESDTLDEYTLNILDRMETFISEDGIECRRWRNFQDVLADFEEERDDRYEELFRYFNFGETPDKLKYALENEYHIDREDSYGSRNRSMPMSVYYRNYADEQKELITMFGSLEYSIEAIDKMVFSLAYYTHGANIYGMKSTTALQLGTSFGGLNLKYAFSVKNSMIPQYTLGYTFGYPVIRGKKYYVTFNALVYDWKTLPGVVYSYPWNTPEKVEEENFDFNERLGYQFAVGLYLNYDIWFEAGVINNPKRTILGVGLGYHI